MAKLSARGRTELARYQRTIPSSEAYPYELRVQYAFMSDGNVLKKIGERSGWKIVRLRPGMTQARMTELVKSYGAVLISGDERQILLDKK